MTRSNIVKLIRDMPSIAVAVANIPIEIVPKERLPWAYGATDGRKIIIRDDLSPDETKFVLLHELLHITFLHVERRKHRNPVRWNIATDIWVNGQLLSAGFKPPADVVIPDDWSKYENLTVEEIYDMLSQEATSSSGGSGDGQTDGSPRIDIHDGWDNPSGQDQQSQGDSASAEEFRKAMDELKRAIAEDMRRSQGTLPAGLQREIFRVEPKLRWNQVLWDLLYRARSRKLRWQRNNLIAITDATLPRFAYHPETIVVGIDTSGSISQEELSLFIAEVIAMARQLRCELVAMACDAEVHDIIPIRTPADAVKLTQIHGGGGTDFRPVFERIKELKCPVAAVIYFTDGYGTFPEEPPTVPTYWVMVTDVKAPFGITIQYPKEGDSDGNL